MATDDELLRLAEQATPGGVSPLGAVEPEPTVLARQSPPGTPGAVEGPVQNPLVDNSDFHGVDPSPPAVLAPPPEPSPPPAPQPSFQAPSLRTGKPTMAGASQALDQATQAGFDVAKAQSDLGAAKGEERAANANVLDKDTDLKRRQLSDVELQQQAHEEGRQRAQEIADKAEQSFADFKLHDYLADRTNAERIKSNIFVGLGAAGQALVGGSNPAWDKLQMLVDNDFKTQQAKLRHRDRFAEMKRNGVTSLENGYKSSIAELQLKHAAAYDAVAAEAKAQMLRNGATVEQAETNVISQGAKEKSLQFKAKALEDLWKDQASLAMSRAALAQKQAPTPPTAAEQKSYDFAARLQRDNDVLAKLGPMSSKGMEILRAQLAYEDGVDKETKAALIAAGKWRTPEQALAESGDPADVDRYVAGHRMATSSLRPDSGAAISGTEYLGWATDHIPQPGDSKSAIETKLAARKQLVRGQAISSGRPGDFGFENPGGIAKPGTPSAKAAPSAKTAPADAPTDRKALAREALKDLNAPAAVKERAKQILKGS